jgi:hypothetical protein
MKILVLGGTGFIGQHAVKLLMAAGHEVAVFHRGQTPGRMPDGTHRMQGNYRRIAAHAAELQSFSPEVVVDMIPITEQNAHGVTAVFRGVARRIVAISSQEVYRAWGVVHGVEAAPADPVLNEEAPLRQSLYLYRGKPIKIYDWDFENYEQGAGGACVSKRSHVACHGAASAHGVRAGRPGAPHVQVCEAHRRRAFGHSAGGECGGVARAARLRRGCRRGHRARGHERARR